MARPTKVGLDYFPFDVNFINDIKIRKLIHHMKGGRGLSVYIDMLSQIYRNGYYFTYDDDTPFIIASDLYEDEDFVRDVIQYCLKVGLFDQSCYNNYKVLTSHGIQVRYKNVVATCKRTACISAYNLLEGNQMANCVPISSEEMNVSSVDTDIGPEENGIISELSMQNKSKRERKEKESPSTAPAHEKENLGMKVSILFSEVEKEVASLKQDAVWCQKIIEYYGIDAEKLSESLDDFTSECCIRGKSSHSDQKDLKSHFNDWYKKKQASKKKAKQHGESSKNTSKRRSAPVPTGATQADYEEAF